VGRRKRAEDLHEKRGKKKRKGQKERKKRTGGKEGKKKNEKREKKPLASNQREEFKDKLQRGEKQNWGGGGEKNRERFVLQHNKYNKGRLGT